MKNLLFFILIILSIRSFGQDPLGYTPIYNQFSWDGGNFKKLGLPLDTPQITGSDTLWAWFGMHGDVLYRYSPTQKKYIAIGDAGTVHWGDLIGTLSNQTDLQGALNAKENALPLGTSGDYLAGDKSLKNFSTAVTTITDPLYVPKGDTIKFILRTDTLRFHNPLYKSGTNDVYIDGSVAAYNSAWTAGFPNKISQPTADGQVWTANTNAGYAEWQTPTTGISQDDADARYFQITNNLSEGTAATMRTSLGLTGSLTNGFGIATLSYFPTGAAIIKADTSTSGLATYARGLYWYSLLNGTKLNISDSLHTIGTNYVTQGRLVNYIDSTKAYFLLKASNLSDLASATTALTNLGGTTIGKNIFTLTNPSATGYVRTNADNTVTQRSYANVKVDLSLDNVENTALSTWAGTANITTLGTITTGVWHSSTKIGLAYGGTNADLSATGGSKQLLQQSSSGAAITVGGIDSSFLSGMHTKAYYDGIYAPIGGGSSGITIGSTTITSGTNTRVLYNNSGVVGEYSVTGSGTTIPLSTSPDFTTGITIGGVAVPTISSTNTLTNKTISGSSNTLSNIPNSSLTNNSITIQGSAVALGGSTLSTSATPQWAREGIGVAADAVKLLWVEGGSTTGTAMFNNSNSSTTGTVSDVVLMATSSGQMTDGYGPILAFHIKDADAVEQFNSFIAGVRDGADNSGKLIFLTYNAGVSSQALSLDHNQLATFGGHVSIEGVTSTGATGTGLLTFSIDPTFTTGITSDAFKLSTSGYNLQTGTTYTLVNSDNGKVVTFNNASAITLTIPASLTAGFSCTIRQLGAGQVTFTASSTTLHNAHSYTKTAAQYALATIIYESSNTYTTGGDMQ